MARTSSKQEEGKGNGGQPGGKKSVRQTLKEKIEKRFSIPIEVRCHPHCQQHLLIAPLAAAPHRQIDAMRLHTAALAILMLKLQVRYGGAALHSRATELVCRLLLPFSSRECH